MKMRVLCVPALCLAIGNVVSGEVVIDNFDSGLVNTTLTSVGNSGFIFEGGLSGVLGSQRVSYLSMITNFDTGENANLKINVSSSSNLALNFQNSGGFALVDYDGLEDVDFTTGGTNAFRLLFTASDSVGIATVVAQTINDGVTNSSSGTMNIVAGIVSPTWFDLPFSSMSGSADFADIDLIQLVLAPSLLSQSPDWTVTSFVADFVIPEPDLGLLLLPVLGGVLVLRRRLSKKG